MSGTTKNGIRWIVFIVRAFNVQLLKVVSNKRNKNGILATETVSYCRRFVFRRYRRWCLFFIFIRLRFGAVKWWHHAHCVYFWLRCGLILAFLQHQRNPFRQSVCALRYILIYTWNISSQKSVIQSKNQALLSFSPQAAAFVCTTQSSSQFLWYYLIHIVRIRILCTTKTRCRNLFASVLKFRSDAHP